MTTTYQLGETPRLEATITDSDDASANPTTTTIKIIDSGGTTKVDDVAMENEDTGSYYYDYDIPSDGDTGLWRYNVTATGSAGRVTIKRSKFNVEVAV